MSATSLLRIDHLNKSFGRVEVLKEISLDIQRGSLHALLGPNGSGKTTLLKCLMGSMHHDKGTIDLSGRQEVQSKAYKQMFVYMPQFPGFLPHLSAREIIQLLVNLRKEKPIHAERLIEDLKIHEFWHRSFKELSGGMKQKINILQCFMFDFEIAFLDEPTASLDPQIAAYLKNLLLELKALGKTMVFTSHIMSEVEEIADYMSLLSNGKMLLNVSPESFIKEQETGNLEQAMLKYWGQHGN